jgi:hypothetical protein
MAYPATNKITGFPTNAGTGAKDTPSQPQLMAEDWCGLGWGPWVPLERETVTRTAPNRSRRSWSGQLRHACSPHRPPSWEIPSTRRGTRYSRANRRLEKPFGAVPPACTTKCL